MRTAADTVSYALGFKNEVVGTGPFSSCQRKREGAGEEKAGAEVLSNVVFIVFAAVAFGFVNQLDMASKGL